MTLWEVGGRTWSLHTGHDRPTQRHLAATNADAARAVASPPTTRTGHRRRSGGPSTPVFERTVA
jgi:hypothetical protein